MGCDDPVRCRCRRMCACKERKKERPAEKEKIFFSLLLHADDEELRASFFFACIKGSGLPRDAEMRGRLDLH